MTKMVKTEEKRKICYARGLSDLFMAEFKKETDRAAGIVGSAILDSTLESTLKSYFVKSPRPKEDLLFDGPNAPLSSFSSKIEMMFRLGLISEKMARALHIVRKIRNSFAHDIINCDFNNKRIAGFIDELTSLLFENKEEYKDVCACFSDGSRGDYQMALSYIVWWFSCGAFLRTIKPRKAIKNEFQNRIGVRAKIRRHRH